MGWKEITAAQRDALALDHAARDVEILRLRRNRWTITAIAKRLHCRPEHVIAVVKQAKEDARAAREQEGEDLVAEEIAVLDEVGAKLMESFDECPPDKVGNLKQLADAIHKNSAERRALLGIDAPKKLNLTHGIDLSKATPEQLERLAAGEDPAKVLGGGEP